MAYNPSTNIVVSGKTFMDVPAVQFKTPDGATVNFAHVGGSIRFSPTLEEQTNNVENFSNAIIDPITSTLLNQLDSDFVAENIKKDVDLFGLLGTLEGGITPSGNKAITATTSTQTGIDVTNYATVSVAPTPSETKSVTTNGDVTPSSGKLLSKVTVNVPTGTARDSSDLTVSGATVNVPEGLYSSAASKSVASGTAGTPTASKSAVSNNSVTVTPSVTNTEGYITGGTKTGTGVKVSASELVSGNKAITPSETAQSGIDVTNFKTASVGAISSTYVGSGVTRKAAATVAPSTSEQTVCASGVYTTGEQKVSAITPSIVGNLDASSFASSIVAAIEGKGVTVPDGTLLDGMASLIDSIEAGGGGGAKIANGKFTPANDAYSYVVTHNLGKPPTIAVFAVYNSLSKFSQGGKLAGIAYYNDQKKKTEHITVQYKLSSAGTGSMFNLSAETTGYLEELTNPTDAPSTCYGIVAYGSTDETITFGNANQSLAKFKSGMDYLWVVVA